MFRRSGTIFMSAVGLPGVSAPAVVAVALRYICWSARCELELACPVSSHAAACQRFLSISPVHRRAGNKPLAYGFDLRVSCGSHLGSHRGSLLPSGELAVAQRSSPSGDCQITRQIRPIVMCQRRGDTGSVFTRRRHDGCPFSADHEDGHPGPGVRAPPAGRDRRRRVRIRCADEASRATELTVFRRAAFAGALASLACRADPSTRVVVNCAASAAGPVS